MTYFPHWKDWIENANFMKWHNCLIGYPKHIMEQLAGKLQTTKGKLIINGEEYNYEEYKDPNRPHNFRTILINRPNKDSIIVEFDYEKDVLQKVAEKVLKNNQK